MKAVVVGGSGMLGSMVVDLFSRQEGLEVYATHRNGPPAGAEDLGVTWLWFDEGKEPFVPSLSPGDWIVNAAGLIRHRIGSGPLAVERAVRANVILPCRLARVASETGAKVLQADTDCVFPGRSPSSETARHDPKDLYGRTKSLGEVDAPDVHHLRCSIVGPEPRPDGASLLEWFLSNPPGKVPGYVDHFWNGVTTLAFARVALAVVTGKVEPLPGQHLVPANHVTKHDLLREFAEAFGRPDLEVERKETDRLWDMRLVTLYGHKNTELWRAAGYDDVPTVRDLVRELAAWDYAFARKEAVS